MARARYFEVATDTSGRPVPGTVVNVYQPGTTTPIVETIYAADTGGTTLANPLTANAQGEIEFYLAAPKRVDLRWVKAGYTTESHAADVGSADLYATDAELIGTYGRVFAVAAPTGVAATDTAAVAAQLALAVAAGGGTVLLADGTYVLSSMVDIPSNTILRGSGFTKLQADPALATTMVRLRGATDVTLVDLTVEHNAVVLAGVVGVISELPGTSDVATRHTVKNVRITNCGNNAFRAINPVVDLKFVDNHLDSSLSGFSMQGAPAASVGIEVSRNTFRSITGPNPCLQLYGGTGVYSLYKDVQICGNRFEDNGATSIPIEPTGCERLVVSGNIIGPSTRGVSLGNNIDTIVADNVFNAQTIYAVEGNNLTRCEIANNIATNCASLFRETGATTGNSGISIHHNICVGTGLASLTAGSNYVRIIGAANSFVQDNYFRSLDYIDVAVRIGSGATADNAVVRNNSFLVDTPNATVKCVNVTWGADPLIEGNRVKITRDLVVGDDSTGVLNASLGGNVVGLAVRDNEVIYTGAVAAAPNHVAIGTVNQAASTLPRSLFLRNHVVGGAIGFVVQSTSADTIFVDNEGRTCVTELGTLNAAVIFRRTRREYEGTAAPTTGTWVRGDRVWNTTPSASGVFGWVCVTAGTPGTWDAMPAGANFLLTDGSYAAAATDALSTRVTGKANPQLTVNADGKVEWGDGTAALDTNLYRSGVANLKTDGSLNVGASLVSLGSAYFGSALDVNMVRTATNQLTMSGRFLMAALAASHVALQVRGTGTVTGDLQQWTDPSNAVYSTVNENGYFTTRKVAAPADAEIATGEAAWWFDSTNGAAKLMVKAKQANGTVVTGSVALA